jgi:hypothetical protein
MSTITARTLEERKKLNYIEWLRAEAARLRDGGDLDEFRVAERYDSEADVLELGWPFPKSQDAAP